MTTVQLSNQHIKPTFVLSIVTVIILSCSAPEKFTDSNYHLLMTPPSGVKVADNFYCDRSEMNNLGWREYSYWTKRTFGDNSVEYDASLPDTLVWRENFSCLESLVHHYLKDPAYTSFPVVGVTQQQANDFSKWRSDRYFEKLLLDMNKIEWDSTQNSDTYFTIEKYFTGTFGKILPGEKVKYYPNFRLPTWTERQQILQYADTVDKTYFEKCNSKYCRDCKTNFPKFYADIIPCMEVTFKITPTINTNDNYAAKKGNPIFHLRGNVSEWSSTKNITLGGGWFDKRERILQADTFYTDKQNAWTGFRNVCEWKQWEE
jgi:hypothetical protein